MEQIRLKPTDVFYVPTDKPGEYIAKTVEEIDPALGEWLRNKHSRLDTESKLIPSDYYGDHFTLEVVYPESYASYFEKELLETISINYMGYIHKAMKSGDDKEIKDVERRLCSEWMGILGSGYRDWSNRVELSKYEKDGQLFYKVRYKATFNYD